MVENYELTMSEWELMSKFEVHISIDSFVH
jgi:hypothetical protein